MLLCSDLFSILIMKAPKHRFRVVNIRRNQNGLESVTVSTHTTLNAAKKAQAKQFKPFIQQWDVGGGGWQRPDQIFEENAEGQAPADHKPKAHDKP